MSPVHQDHSADAAVAAMKTVRDSVPVTADGTPIGLPAGRTLPVRVELSRQLRRRRTQLALGFMALLPVILVIAFAFGSNTGARGAVSPGRPGDVRLDQLRHGLAVLLGEFPADRGDLAVLRRHHRVRGVLVVAALPAGDAGPPDPAASGRRCWSPGCCRCSRCSSCRSPR